MAVKFVSKQSPETIKPPQFLQSLSYIIESVTIMIVINVVVGEFRGEILR